jgi:plastocyanin
MTVLLAVALLVGASAAGAQPLTERTPNLEGTWVTSPRNLHFQFAHRFQVAGDDKDITDIFSDGKIVNYPTFALSYGVGREIMAGFRYSSNSLVANQVNEWQPYLKWSPLYRSGESAWSVSLTGAYNGAAESFDAELSGQVDLLENRLFLIGTVRGFTDSFTNAFALLDEETGEEALALAGGLGIRLNRYVTLAGDYGQVVSGVNAPAGWSAGLHVGIPHTPHTFSIMATNVSSGTLQGVSTGIDDTFYWGFEFTVPFSGFARWGKIFDPDDSPPETGTSNGALEPGTGAAAERGWRAVPPGMAVEIEIKDFKFDENRLEVTAGTKVRWVNRDPVAHTSTADGRAWDSPLIGPGETYEVTFDEAGEFTYHCRPHPFMKAVVVVTEAEEGNGTNRS